MLFGFVGLSFAINRKASRITASGIMVMPKTLCHPYALASRGANRLAMTVPILPAAAMPITNPCCEGGYQRLARGSAMAKDAPATPSIRPIPKRAGKFTGINQPSESGINRKSSMPTPTHLVLKRSLNTPMGNRKREPLRVGMATIKPC